MDILCQPGGLALLLHTSVPESRAEDDTFLPTLSCLFVQLKLFL